MRIVFYRFPNTFKLFLLLSFAIISVPFIVSGFVEFDESAFRVALSRCIINISVKKFNGTFYNIEKSLNVSETVVYVDMWRSHWCTYYNDRSYFISPRINEILQILRKYGLRVVTISSIADHIYSRTKQRIAVKKLLKNFYNKDLSNYYVRQEDYHDEFIPGFKDACIYKDQSRYDKERNNRLSPDIMLAYNDLIVSNFREAVEVFLSLNATTVIVLGQHTNMCLMAVLLYCKKVNLDIIIVEDLTDSCYVYDIQKSDIKNHSDSNKVVLKYLSQSYGSLILSYNLIKSFRKKKPIKMPRYNLFKGRSFHFTV